MLKTIIINEFIDNILNLRFIVGFLLCIIIIVSCVIILSHDYQKEMKDYNLRISLQNEFLDNYAHTNRIGQKDPTYGSNSFLDVSDRPRFSFKEETLLGRLGAGLPYWGFLLFFNVLFFAMAFLMFLRYDVR